VYSKGPSNTWREVASGKTSGEGKLKGSCRRSTNNTEEKEKKIFDTKGPEDGCGLPECSRKRGGWA